MTISVSAGTARSMRRQRRIGSGRPATRAATSISLSSYGMDAAAASATSGGAPIRIAASSACPAASAFAWYRVRSCELPRRTRSSPSLTCMARWKERFGTPVSGSFARKTPAVMYGAASRSE